MILLTPLAISAQEDIGQMIDFMTATSTKL